MNMLSACLAAVSISSYPVSYNKARPCHLRPRQVTSNDDVHLLALQELNHVGLVRVDRDERLESGERSELDVRVERRYLR